jgi:thiosulfate/3-mercaptopyruvate sulfurtransferase
VAGRIPGSQHLDLLHEFSDESAGYHFAHPQVDHALAVLRSLGVTDQSQVVVYDQGNGFWSARLWWSLRALGLDAQVLNGGLQAWREAGLRVDSGTDGATRGPSTTPLTLTPRPEAWATVDDVLAVVQGTSDETLVCALGADQFYATAPTRYARRGHIPTSVNLPARDLSSKSDGTTSAEQALAGALPVLGSPGLSVDQTEDVTGATSTGRGVLLYCGGGISASYAALGLTIAGYRRVRVYDGSLEEWSANPALPLASNS